MGSIEGASVGSADGAIEGRSDGRGVNVVGVLVGCDVG